MEIIHHNGYDCSFYVNLGHSNALDAQSFTLNDFNTFFQNNDIQTLANIFLNLEFDFVNYMYDYDRISTSFGTKYSSSKTTSNNRQQFDEIFSSITSIYAKLLKKLNEKEAEVMSAYSNILNILNIVNYRLIEFGHEPVDVTKYLNQFSENKILSDAVYMGSIETLIQSFNDDTNTDYSNQINKRILNELGKLGKVNTKALDNAYKEADLIKNGSQLDIISHFIKSYKQ